MFSEGRYHQRPSVGDRRSRTAGNGQRLWRYLNLTQWGSDEQLGVVAARYLGRHVRELREVATGSAISQVEITR